MSRPRGDWRANLNRRFAEWCGERGEPAQQTEVGQKAAAAIAKRAARHAQVTNKNRK